MIDADAHVIESERTWDYLEGPDQRFRPLAVTSDREDGRWWRTFWQIDGQIYSRAAGDPTLDLAIRDLSDIPGRLRMMDRLGVEIQVIYPTFFLQGQPTRHPEGQIALARAYNRWMADVCSRGEGRLRWTIVPPLADMNATLAELEFGKQHGACGVFMRGIEGDRVLKDPYFFPLYEKASELNLPICIHAGNGSNEMKSLLFRQDLFFYGVTPVLAAFNALVTGGIPQRFPKLRFGFVETGAQWVPYLIREAIRRRQRINTPGEIADETTAMKDLRLFVACRTDDDLPYILRWAGEDNLLIGTDFGHEDPAAELEALSNLGKKGDVDPAVVQKMLADNARAFYGL